jgi:hypothetical protein
MSGPPAAKSTVRATALFVFVSGIYLAGESNMSHDSADDEVSDAPEEQPVCPSSSAGDIADESDSHTANCEAETTDAEEEPRPPIAPARTWKQVWAFVRDPSNANAIIAIVTVMIFLTGVFYTVFSCLQWRVMRGQLAVMKAAQRPNVGVSEVRTTDENGVPGVVVILKNFGQSPAFNFSAQWPFFINGDKLAPQSSAGPATTITLYPGVEQALKVTFGGAEGRRHWQQVVSGGEVLSFRAIRSYGWTAEQKEYQECDEHQYDPVLRKFRAVRDCLVTEKIDR